MEYDPKDSQLMQMLHKIIRALPQEELMRAKKEIDEQLADKPMNAVKFPPVFSGEAFKEIVKIASVMDEIEDPYLFAICFCILHPEFDLSSSEISEEDKGKLFDLVDRFKKFEAQRGKDEHIWDTLEAFIKQEAPASAGEIIEHLTAVLPEQYVIPNSKLSNTLTKGIIDIGEITLAESRNAKKPIEVTCILTYEGENVKLTGRQSFTEYDRVVYNALCSLFVYGDQSHIVTPAMVYRAMTGLTDTEKPTPKQLRAIETSINKMRFIRAQVDCTQEMQARNIRANSPQINGGLIDTNLLMGKWLEVTAGGQTVKAFKIVDVPILYEYSALLRQVLTLPASRLDIKELDANGKVSSRSLPNTESRLLIKDYLLRRIEGMKGKNALRNPIIALYDYQRDGETRPGLFSIAGNPEPTRTEAARIRADIEKMLSYWAATKYIKKFEPQTERKKITGYKITV